MSNNSMLPSSFYYQGMHKIKAGKGYLNQITGHHEVLGVETGPCNECDGIVIALKICTSAKGFETTTEKVCNKCGLVHPGAFQVLDKKEEDYIGKYYHTHEDWLKDNKPSIDMDDIDKHLEYQSQIIGARPKESVPKAKPTDINNSTIRLFKAFGRLANTPQSMKIPREVRRYHEYHLIADDYIHELDLNKVDALDVHYYIDHNTMYMGRYKADDIIYHICLIIGRKDLRKCKRYNRPLYDLLIDKLDR